MLNTFHRCFHWRVLHSYGWNTFGSLIGTFCYWGSSTILLSILHFGRTFATLITRIGPKRSSWGLVCGVALFRAATTLRVRSNRHLLGAFPIYLSSECWTIVCGYFLWWHHSNIHRAITFASHGQHKMESVKVLRWWVISVYIWVISTDIWWLLYTLLLTKLYINIL